MKVASALVVALAVVAPLAAVAITDADILNFALNLEYLEAEFYSCAAFGTPLADSLRGGGPASTGCQKANLTGAGQAYASEIAKNEIAHVTFLRAALGSAAVPIPAINIGSAFSAAANAAFGMTLSPPFSPYANALFFYHGAFIFEDVGVTAYKGAAPLITNKTYLSAAAGILAVESYHGGIVRTLLYQNLNVVTPYNVTVEVIVDAISELRNTLDNGLDGNVSNADDFGIVAADGTPILVPVPANAIVPGRTPQEVLQIVYGGGATKGLFFPNGINGVINSTAASS